VPEISILSGIFTGITTVKIAVLKAAFFTVFLCPFKAGENQSISINLRKKRRKHWLIHRIFQTQSNTGGSV
jgi:hypothetical protein